MRDSLRVWVPYNSDSEADCEYPHLDKVVFQIMKIHPDTYSE